MLEGAAGTPWCVGGSIGILICPTIPAMAVTNAVVEQRIHIGKRALAHEIWGARLVSLGIERDYHYGNCQLYVLDGTCVRD